MHEKSASSILKHWLQKRKNNPYPSPSEKSKLMQETGLNRSQLDHWFTNARQRYVHPKSRRGPNPNYSRYPLNVTKVLVEWLTNPANMDHPYPSSEEQAELMRRTRLTKRQLQNWFTNARKRRLANRVLKQKINSSEPECSGTKNTECTSWPCTSCLSSKLRTDNSKHPEVSNNKKRSVEKTETEPQRESKKKFCGQNLETEDSCLPAFPGNPVNRQLGGNTNLLLSPAMLMQLGSLFAQSLLSSNALNLSSPISTIDNNSFTLRSPLSLNPFDASKFPITSPRDVCDIASVQGVEPEQDAASMMLGLCSTEKA